MNGLHLYYFRRSVWMGLAEDCRKFTGCTPSVKCILTRKYSTDNKSNNYAHDALRRDTYLKRNLDYLRQSPKYSSTTYRRLPRSIVASAESLDTIFGNAAPYIQSHDGDKGGGQNDDIGSVRKPVLSNCLRSLNKERMETLLYALADKRAGLIAGVSDEFVELLSVECARRVALWNPFSCVLFVDLWLEWRGHSIVHGAFFEILLKEWSNYVPTSSSRSSVSGNASPSQIRRTLALRPLVQLMFYVGIRKSSSPTLMSKSETVFENHLSDLDDKELVIVCQGYFKSGTRIGSTTLLNEIANRVKSSLVAGQMSLDEYDLLSFLKVLRHANFAGNDCGMLAELANCFKSNRLISTNMTSLAHFAATFANFKYHDEQLLNIFEDTFVRELAVLERKDDGRSLKDVARILWAFSSLNRPNSESPRSKLFGDKILRHLRRWVSSNEQLKGKEVKERFVDCLQSLVVMRMFPKDLLRIVVATKFSKQIYAMENRKAQHQLFFIAESVRIEASDIQIPAGDGWESMSSGILPGADIFGELRRRPDLETVRQIIHELCGGNTDFYRCTHLLNHIYIAGFEMCLDGDSNLCELYKKSSCRLAIEILDERVCLHDSTIPEGMMSAKMRQLRKIGFKVVEITSESLRQFKDSPASQRVEFVKTVIMNSILSS